MNTRTIIWLILLAIAGIFGIPQLINYIKTHYGEESETKSGKSGAHGGEPSIYEDCHLMIKCLIPDSKKELLYQIQNIINFWTKPVSFFDGFYILDNWTCGLHMVIFTDINLRFSCTKHPTTTVEDMAGQIKQKILEGIGLEHSEIFVQNKLTFPGTAGYYTTYQCQHNFGLL